MASAPGSPRPRDSGQSALNPHGGSGRHTAPIIPPAPVFSAALGPAARRDEDGVPRGRGDAHLPSAAPARPGRPPRPPREPRTPRRPRQPRTPRTPRRPREPRAPRRPRQPRQPRHPRVPRSPREPRRPRTPRHDVQPPASRDPWG
ncbi:tegument protein US11 [Macacine alphaherpesvirus 1]|uniref:Tegument protein US11 n=1 Tax=Macacine alphaherpesvirus 2 TaxID=2845554 RepID=A0A1X9WF58_9ALPH|nr:tegument protein US11 [Macacine alphaherpesvirus 1]ARS01708.1 tegument protein US11 [Macacine alphaherpesvirus 2]